MEQVGVQNRLMEEPMDKVEWEIVRADIAMEKARLKANGDWAKWEEFQTQSNRMRAAYTAPADWVLAALPRTQRPGWLRRHWESR